MNTIEIGLLLSYNVNVRINLITATKNHPEKGLIYSVLQKRLENAEIKELPMLIYNTSVDPSKYESILDILNENKAIKLARLIVSIAIQQDQIGYIYSRLYQYLEIFSANELQMFFESQIFFFQIPTDSYEEYQVSDQTIVSPYSDHKTFPEIRKYMKNVENQVLEMPISTRALMMMTRRRQTRGLMKAVMAYYMWSLLGMLAVVFCIPLSNNFGIEFLLEQNIRYDSVNSERAQEQKLQKDPEKIKVPIEYFAINLQEFTRSNQQQSNQNQKEVAKMLNNLAERDATILEKESIKIIIDFKWDTYAQKFFSIQLGLFICFIIGFIFEVVGVSKNSHIFSNDDSNQTIPRIISILILIPFAIYEIANIKITKSKYFENYWNVNDLLLIFVYGTYFTMTFTKPDQLDALKSLQLLIVIFTFIKFSFLIRILTKVSFLVRMLIVVFKELLIFLFFFLLVIGTLTVMAQIIIQESGDAQKGIKLAAYFVIVLRQSIGDYDTS